MTPKGYFGGNRVDEFILFCLVNKSHPSRLERDTAVAGSGTIAWIKRIGTLSG
jgi:hypothetical protein